MYNLIQKRPLCLNKIDVIEKLSYCCYIINNVFGPTEFALIWVEVRMFRAFLLVERVTSTNSEFLIHFLIQGWCKSGRVENAISFHLGH